MSMIDHTLESSRRQGTRRGLRQDPRYVVTRLLSLRPRSVAEIRKRLLEKGFASAVVEAVVAEFTESGLLGDGAFARSLAESVLKRKPVGRRFLHARLRRSGVAAPLITRTLNEVLPREREHHLAEEAFREKLRVLTTRGVSRATIRVRAGQHLLQRGFSSDLTLEVLDAHLNGARS
jgi:SOS response regulatory protein OraA/RecX